MGRLEVKWRCICLSCTDSVLTSTWQAGVSKLTDAKALVDDLKQKAGEQSRQLADKQAEADAALREITASMQVGPRPSKSHRSAWEITNSNTYTVVEFLLVLLSIDWSKGTIYGNNSSSFGSRDFYNRFTVSAQGNGILFGIYNSP